MTKFLNNEAWLYYGFALTPLCPCEAAGRFVQTNRYGLDSAGGSFAFDQLIPDRGVSHLILRLSNGADCRDAIIAAAIVAVSK